MQMPTDDDDDFEDDQAYDADDSDSEPTVPCPWCKREILEDCDRCPFCEQYLSIEDAPLFPEAKLDYRRYPGVSLYCLSLDLSWALIDSSDL